MKGNGASTHSHTPNNTTTTSTETTPGTFQRIPQLPDSSMLQEAYDEGARDMSARMDTEVERRVRDQLSLRARVQASNEREQKATQEYQNYETRLKESLVSEDETTTQLNGYVEALFERQQNTPVKPLMCTGERNACLECYAEASKTTKIPIDCASKIEAFARCADGL